jgi:hypothetical protein
MWDLWWLSDLLWAILAAALIGAALYFWKMWLHSRPGFSGNWKATFTSRDKTKNEEDIVISSFLGIVRGSSTCKWTDLDGKPRAVTYKIRGRRKERTIVANYIATDQNSLDMGVFLVRIRAGGKTGEGIVTSYDSPPDEEFDFKHLDACTDYAWKKVLKQ